MTQSWSTFFTVPRDRIYRCWRSETFSFPSFTFSSFHVLSSSFPSGGSLRFRVYRARVNASAGPVNWCRGMSEHTHTQLTHTVSPSTPLLFLLFLLRFLPLGNQASHFCLSSSGLTGWLAALTGSDVVDEWHRLLVEGGIVHWYAGALHYAQSSTTFSPSVPLLLPSISGSSCSSSSSSWNPLDRHVHEVIIAILAMLPDTALCHHSQFSEMNWAE